jgi:tRNA pseudouridine38-40 synthase
MARYQVILAYDGTEFCGFQRQGTTRTVQVEVEQALRQLGWQGQTILSAGRTDSGVHAEGQVIAFDLEWNHPAHALLMALNAHLPADIAAQALQEADADFHPRYHARSRSYRYRIYCQPGRNPLRDRYAWRVWPAVTGELLHAAAATLPGTYDCAAFGSPMKPGGSTIRTVFKAGWNWDEENWHFEVTANAFLYHMVRRMVYLQVLVAQSRLSLKDFTETIQAAQSQVPGLAPPQGLVLKEVSYREAN